MNEKNTSVSYSKKSLWLHIPLVVFLLTFAVMFKNEPLRQGANTEVTNGFRPNIILIVLDTVRGDHTSLYGYERDTTPNLKKLAENATLYTHAIAPSDWTLPSHASIFTGLYPQKHGAYHRVGYLHGGHPLSDKAITLAEILSDIGYQTIGIVANYGYLAFGHNMTQGFKSYEVMRPNTFIDNTSKYLIRQSLRDILIPFSPQNVINQVHADAAEVNKNAFTLLERVTDSDNPFFMFINYMDAHEPYAPPDPFDTLFPGKNPEFIRANYRKLWVKLARGEHQLTAKERLHLTSQYDGAIAYLDFHISRLMDRLKELGLYESSLLIITSDHGEALGERDLMGHHVSVYQNQVHVPLIIKFPNDNKRQIVERTVSLVDILPTILDILNVDKSEEIQGRSLLSLDSNKSRNIFSLSVPNKWFLHYERFRRIEGALYAGKLKFIKSTNGKKELYNLEIDPLEKHNIFRPNDPQLSIYEDKLEWLFDIELFNNGQKEAKLDDDTRKNLKSLGYIK